MLRVSALPAFIEALSKAGLHFRNEVEVGPGGKQIQIEDPDGSPIELFELAENPDAGQLDARTASRAAVRGLHRPRHRDWFLVHEE